MAPKRYATDEAKSKSRDLVRTMIESTLLTYKKPSEIKVICFPGIDCAEVKEVYDRLGILRANITGIEREREVASEIRSQNLGINLVEGTLEDYIERRGRHDFDVISLDYIGPMRHSTLDVLRKFIRGQEKDQFLLHHANLLRRDKDSYGLYYYGNAVADKQRVQLGDMPSPHDFSKGIEEGVIHFLKKNKANEKLTAEKEMAYSSLIQSVYTGSSPVSISRFFKYAGGRAYVEIIQKLKSKHPLCSQIDIDDPFGSTAKSPFFPVLQNILERVIYEALMCDFTYHGFHEQTNRYLSWIMLFTASKDSKFFMPLQLEKYSYISQSGAPMIGDVMYLKYPRKAKRYCDELAQIMNFHREVSFSKNDFYRIHKLNSDYAQYMNEYKPLESFSERFTAPRTFLGNSFKPKLTKEKVIAAFREGLGAAEVRARYRGWEDMPLQQWKAHVTMGTYDFKEDRVPTESDVVQLGTPDGSSELESVLSKDEVLDLLSSGIPIGEIVDAFPGTFTPGQLAAFKAHITMGTYEKRKTGEMMDE